MTTLEELQAHLDKFMNDRNNSGLSEFENYSPFEMHHILHDTFGAQSPIRLRKLIDEEYKQIPILNQVKFLADIVVRFGEIKLTKLGFLPTKIVAELYSQGFMKESHIESHVTKLYKETDSNTVHIARIILEISGLAKKRNNKLSLTKSADKLLNDDDKLFQLILKTYCEKFNWAHLDYYGENNIGQLGFGFSIILIHKYGAVRHSEKLYIDKYFKAYPMLLENISYPAYSTKERYAGHCYSLRTFERFLDWFGFIHIEKERKIDAELMITKTETFDKVFEILPHKF